MKRRENMVATGWGFFEKFIASVAVLETVQPEGWLCGTLHIKSARGLGRKVEPVAGFCLGCRLVSGKEL
jgi:hypothetical protein